MPHSLPSFADNKNITKNNYAAALGMPKKRFSGKKPQVVFRQWCKRHSENCKRRGIASGDVAALRQWLANNKRLHGPDHPETLCSMLALATVENAETAQELEQSVVNGLVRRAEKSDAQPLDVVERFASSLQTIKLDWFAATAWGKCHGASRLVLGEDHPSTVGFLHRQGCSLLQSGQLALSVEVLSQCLSHRRSVLGDDHSDTQETGRRLLAAHHRQDTLLSSGVPQLVDMRFPHLDLTDCAFFFVLFFTFCSLKLFSCRRDIVPGHGARDVRIDSCGC